jgi:D-alanyl-D-alanine carboxypeptidase/D-alanyl-D-alanine-endopeptidase (penicillin-binding protein 4)
VERSAFPIYGNAMTFNLDSATGLLSSPQEFFKRYVMLGDTVENSDMVREFDSNRLTYYPSSERQEEEFNIPFRYSSEIFARLLTDTLKRRVLPVKKDPAAFVWQKVHSVPTDSAVRVMMQISDNFIAEQLMIMNGAALSDSLDSRAGIQAAKREYMEGIPDDPVWVDGSGLSRFNLFTPRSIVWLWKELYETYGRERLFSLIAKGGQKGTLKSYYVSDPPFLYGKTGTLSNNNSLSGFLVTKKGRLFIFSMMHNNYPGYSSPVKRNMERILSDLYENN